MDLVDWLIREEIPLTAFCRRFGLNRVTISAILKGADPKLSTAKKIVDATDGEVSYESLLFRILRKREKGLSADRMISYGINKKAEEVLELYYDRREY